jgi:hypothetical protein
MLWVKYPEQIDGKIRVKNMCLLRWHSGRESRVRYFQPKRQSRFGRRWWKYHASCSVNL